MQVLTRRQCWLVCLCSIVVYIVIASFRSACGIYNYVPANDIVFDLVTTSIGAKSGNVTRMCPVIPVFQITKMKIVTEVMDSPVLDNIEPGGAWKPDKCVSQHKVAIIVPYRNRESQLKIFLQHMHPFLQQQMLDYRIIIVEQAPNTSFNRAALFNVGFMEALKLHKFHCFIFHDVDLLPEDVRNIYGCSHQPRHMSSSVNVFRYNLPYRSIFGGAIAMTADQFAKVNGYSNKFFGWGGEDDDMYNRVQNQGMEIIRWDPDVAKYRMIVHAKEPASGNRHELLKTGKLRYRNDGLNSLKYERIRMEFRQLYTWYLVNFHSEDH